MRRTLRWLSLIVLTLSLALPSLAQNRKAADPEADYYKLFRFELPKDEVIEPGAIEVLPDGKVAVGTRRGEIWMIENAFDKDPKKATFKLYASGLHEVLGLAYRDGWLYCMQRCELTKMKDTDGCGRADVFRTVNDDWAISGDYH